MKLLCAQESLWDIARRCTEVGIPLGAAAAVKLGGAGAMVVPGVGGIPGALAGFLAVQATGTAACTAANMAYRDQLRELAGD